MLARLILCLALACPLAACGACQGHVSNYGSAGRCSVLSVPM